MWEFWETAWGSLSGWRRGLVDLWERKGSVGCLRAWWRSLGICVEVLGE